MRRLLQMNKKISLLVCSRYCSSINNNSNSKPDQIMNSDNMDYIYKLHVFGMSWAGFIGDPAIPLFICYNTSKILYPTFSMICKILFYITLGLYVLIILIDISYLSDPINNTIYYGFIQIF